MRIFGGLALLGALLLPALALAQSQRVDQFVVNLGYGTDGYVHPLQLDSGYNLKVNCVTGCSSGGGGGTVAQGAAGASAWLVSDATLDAIISGGKAAVSDATLDAIISGGKAAVSDATLDAIISGGKVPVSGTFWQSTQPVTEANLDAALGPVTPATATATKALLVGCQGASTQPTFTAGQQGYLPCDLSGSLYVHPAGGSLLVYAGATSSSGPSWAHYVNSATSAMATNVKSTGGNVYTADVCNSNASPVYFHLYNTSSAPTVGATSQLVETKQVNATSCASLALADVGGTLGTGISFDVTTGSLADADTTVISAANTVAVTFWYK